MKSLSTKMNMRAWYKLAFVWCAAIATLTFSACSYDDGDLWKSVNNLEDRVTTLEKQVSTLNTNYESLSTLVKAMEENLAIVSVEKLADNEGYKITFTDDKSIILTNGKDGKDGENGEDGKDGANAPVIGVGLDATDGLYYWNITTDGETKWLLDISGKKMPVSGSTPMVGVNDEGFWTVSYDRGVTYILILDGAGKPIKAKADNGLIKSVTTDNDFVYITLNDADGTVIKVIRESSFSLTIQDVLPVNLFNYGQTRTFNVTTNGVARVVITKPGEWKANLVDGVLSITAPTVEHASCAEMAGEVALIYFNDNGLSRVATMGVSIAPNQQIPTYYAVAIPTDFSESNVQQVLVDGVKVAEICYELICTTDAGGVSKPMTVVYPMANGVADLTKGLAVADGGSITWNTTANTVAYMPGAAAVAQLYVDAEGNLLTALPENAVAQAAMVKPEMLRDERDIDVQEYPLVKIGTQYWMGESLRAYRYIDGTPIALASDWSNEKGAFTYLYNDITNAALYGVLYSGRTVFSGQLAPEGWAVCSADDVAAMQKYIGSNATGTKLKSVAGWTKYPGDNLSGFNAIPGMYYVPGDNVENWGNTTPQVAFWTATEVADVLNPKAKSAVYYSLSDNNTRLAFDPNPSNFTVTAHSLDFGHYVRCVRK